MILPRVGSFNFLKLTGTTTVYLPLSQRFDLQGVRAITRLKNPQESNPKGRADHGG
jgi:hypothetical protein